MYPVCTPPRPPLPAASHPPGRGGDSCPSQALWTDQHGGASGFGRPIPDTDETGYFWFFEPDKLELAVKVLDGRAINGKFWFFFGALSDVEYLITVTDRETGAVRTYHNPPGELCGGADIVAFDP